METRHRNRCSCSTISTFLNRFRKTMFRKKFICKVFHYTFKLLEVLAMIMQLVHNICDMLKG